MGTKFDSVQHGAGTAAAERVEYLFAAAVCEDHNCSTIAHTTANKNNERDAQKINPPRANITNMPNQKS